MIDKTLTIGVEIEMTGISLMDAAKMVAQTLGTPDLPIDQADTSIYDRKLVKDRTGRTWTIERDGSITTEADRSGRNSGLNSVELVTPILHYEDIETLQKGVHGAVYPGGGLSHRCRPEPHRRGRIPVDRGDRHGTLQSFLDSGAHQGECFRAFAFRGYPHALCLYVNISGF